METGNYSDGLLSGGETESAREKPLFDRSHYSNIQDFGLFLQRERELRGVTLDEISSTTRINIRHLEALERGETERLPPTAFVKGFLAAYAKYIGLDPDEVLTYYEEVSLREAEGAEKQKEDELSSLGKRHLRWVVPLAGLALLLWVWMAVSHRPGEVTPVPGEAEIAEAPATEYEAVREPGEDAVIAPGETAVPDQAGPETPREQYSVVGSNSAEGGSGVDLVLKAVEKSWIYAVIDEQDARDLFLYPGENIGLSARRVINLTLGNAGGVEVVFNGREMGALGNSGEVKRNLLFKWDPDSGPGMEKALDHVEEGIN